MPSPSIIAQAAAIPIDSGRICLVNSSSGRGWVIPKGHIEPGDTARDTAARETWEEAGLLGVLHETPIGAYRYEKNGATYRVVVFLMEVTETADAWPEDHRRTRLWIRPEMIEQLVQVPGLRRLLGKVHDLEAITAD